MLIPATVLQVAKSLPLTLETSEAVGHQRPHHRSPGIHRDAAPRSCSLCLGPHTLLHHPEHGLTRKRPLPYLPAPSPVRIIPPMFCIPHPKCKPAMRMSLPFPRTFLLQPFRTPGAGSMPPAILCCKVVSEVQPNQKYWLQAEQGG